MIASRAGLVAALATSALAGASPALACNEATHARAVRSRVPGGGAPLVIGDSTLIISAPMLGRLGVEADAHGCRQFGQGLDIITRRQRHHHLPDAVALALGANGPVSGAQLSRARRVVGAGRFLILVTPRNSASTAAAMRRAQRAHPDRVLTLDWARFSAGHPGWFAGDSLHVDPGGARAYARFIADGLHPFLGPPRGRPLDLPRRTDAPAAKACGTVAGSGRTVKVFITRGAGAMSCAWARHLMRGPRLHPPRRWSFYDWRGLHRGPWTDVLARHDHARVVAGIARTGVTMGWCPDSPSSHCP